MKESETVEFKRSTSELKEAIISMVAILNKHGKGTVYFGMRNDGTVIGQTVTEKTLRDVSRAVSEHIEPRIYPRIERMGDCIMLTFEGNEQPYFAYGKAYKRVADEDRQLSARELENMILRKNKEKIRWDAEICARAKLKDLSVDKFRSLARNSKRIEIGNESKKLTLKKLNLLKEERLTNAAVLLFARTPGMFLDNITVRCGRFKGVEKEEFFDMKDFNGNLFDNLENIINFIKEHLSLKAEIKGMQRIESWEIPLEVLRESVINALIHRDYTKPGYIYVKIYDDAITISNPGELPEELTIEDLFREHESIPRNILLADTFYYAGYIDTWGRGILNIIKKLDETGLERPSFEQSGGYFRITITRGDVEKGVEKGVERGVELLSQNQKEILDQIMKNPNISKREIQDILNIGKKAVDYNIEILKKKGVLRRIGPARGGYWEVRI